MLPKHMDILRLRIAVAHLGEKANCGWWDSAFLDPIGFRYLSLIYPKTFAAAAVLSASEAACRVHDDGIGKGRVTHLFRMPPEVEAKVRKELTQLESTALQGICTKEAAFKALDEIAAGNQVKEGVGALQVGTLKESSGAAGVARLAATYAAGFRSGTRVFPYFA